MKTVLMTAALFCILAMVGIANAQGRYALIAASDDIAIIENPVDRKLNIGDTFYIIRRKGLDEMALAIAKVERFKGEYCRVRITERIMNLEPRQGDYLIDYDPTRYSPWGDNFENGSNTQSQPQPQPEYSSVFETNQGPSEKKFIIALFTGLGLSNFNSEDIYGPGFNFTQSSYVPLGTQFLVIAGSFQIGGEVNYAVMPFTFENKTSGGQVAWEDQIQQLEFGAVGRFNLIKGPAMPFIRAGAGFYTGDAKRKYSKEFKDEYLMLTGENLQDDSVKLDTNFGFNFGAGVSIRNGFIEFVYHLVNRTMDQVTVNQNGKEVVDKVSIKGNNWAVQIGAQIPL